MDNPWINIGVEVALFTLLGVLYYFFQKRRIIREEENKGPLIMGFILQSCLTERGDTPVAELDVLIEALDDYLRNVTPTPPLALLKRFAESGTCSTELREVILEGLDEYGKK